MWRTTLSTWTTGDPKRQKTEASEVAMRREAEKAADLQQQLQATIRLYKREMSLRKKYHNELCQLRGCYSCMQSMVWGLGRVIHCCYACILHYSGWLIFICAHWVVCTFQEMWEWWSGYILLRKVKLQWSTKCPETKFYQITQTRTIPYLSISPTFFSFLTGYHSQTCGVFPFLLWPDFHLRRLANCNIWRSGSSSAGMD